MLGCSWNFATRVKGAAIVIVALRVLLRRDSCLTHPQREGKSPCKTYSSSAFKNVGKLLCQRGLGKLLAIPDRKRKINHVCKIWLQGWCWELIKTLDLTSLSLNHNPPKQRERKTQTTSFDVIKRGVKYFRSWSCHWCLQWTFLVIWCFRQLSRDLLLI